MRHKATLFAIGLSAALAYGQDDLSAMEKRGSKLYENYDYKAAAKHLSAVDEKSAETYRKLAHSYVMTEEYQLAEQTYQSLYESSARIPQDMIDYSRILMMNGRYEKAEEVLKAYSALSPSDAEARRYELLTESLNGYTVTGGNFAVSPWEMNTCDQDFAPAMSDGVMYFTSTRSHKPSFVHRRWNGNRKPFLDVYRVDDEDKKTEKAELFGKTSKKYHDGPIAFSRDGKFAFITRNETRGRSENGVLNFSLLVSEKTLDGWSDPMLLPFSSLEYSTGHAAVSPDGNTLVFASDMPGGKGGSDLYMVTRTGGNWSTPVNLEKINTAGDEMFPYFQGEKVFMFSSDGLPGYGGLDVFAGPWKDNTVTRFRNLGAPLNSPHDDFSPYIDPAMTMGYIASNRDGGQGSDDIYRFTMAKPISFGWTVEGVARDMSGKALPGTRIVLRNSEGSVIGEDFTDDAGNFSFETELPGSFVLVGTRSNYFQGESVVAVREDSPDEIMKDVILEKDPGFALAAVVTDKSSRIPLEGVKVTLLNNMTGISEIKSTNAAGEVLSPIRDKKLNERISYNIRLEKPGYLSKTVTYNRELNKEGRYVVSDELNLTLQKADIGVDLGKAMDLKPIYFDYGKYTIRTDAAVELDKIVQIMNENPSMIVELGSHTDCRGSAKANKTLSQKRAAASATYIQKRITNPSRISAMGYGESRILNGCECEGKVKPVCGEDEHALNRRTEFLILKM
jgi:outer membrane protein OmpA-like peptidoglycan-associated protein